MSSPLISGGPLLSLWWSARVRHCLCLLIRVVDRCVSLLVRLICRRIILTASSPGSLLICHSLVIHLLVLPPFAFSSSEVRRLLLDFSTYGDTDPLGMFPHFLKRTADVMALRLSVVFGRLVHLCSFPACWRQANVTPITKGPPSSSVANWPIAITSVLSKMFERLVSVRLGRFMGRSGTYEPPRCRISQYRRIFVPLSVSLWNDLPDPMFGGVGLAGMKSRANAFLLA